MSGQVKPAAPRRRSSHVRPLLAHAAVGVSREAELLRFPPEGFQPLVQERRLGSGDARFQVATGALFTLQAFVQAGLPMRVAEQALDEGYAGLEFTAAGEASVPAAQDVLYGPSGDPFVQPGAIVLFGEEQARRMLITHAEVAGRESVLTLGYCDEDGPAGEVSVYVQHRDDDTVWAVVRSCFAGGSGVLRALLGKKNEGLSEGERFVPVLDALHPASGLTAGVVSDAAAADAGEADAGAADDAAIEAEELTAEELAATDGVDEGVEVTVEETTAESAEETVEATEESAATPEDAEDDARREDNA